MATVKQISIKDTTSSTGYDTRDIGADALNIDVQYDNNGNIVTDLKTQTPSSSATRTLPEVLSDVANIKVDIGTGLKRDASEKIVPDFGTGAGKVVQGNDARLSDARPNPEALTLPGGGVYDGSVAMTLNAPPKNHASTGATYGIGDSTNYGHVKVTDVYTVGTGEAQDGVAASQKAVNEVYKIAQEGSYKEWIGTQSDWDNDTGSIKKAKLNDGDIVNITDDSPSYAIDWTGTKAQYEAQKDSIPQGSIVAITDDSSSTVLPNLASCLTTSNKDDIAGAGAIQELNTNLKTINNNVTTLNKNLTATILTDNPQASLQVWLDTVLHESYIPHQVTRVFSIFTADGWFNIIATANNLNWSGMAMALSDTRRYTFLRNDRNQTKIIPIQNKCHWNYPDISVNTALSLIVNEVFSPTVSVGVQGSIWCLNSDATGNTGWYFNGSVHPNKWAYGTVSMQNPDKPFCKWECQDGSTVLIRAIG